MSTSCLGHGNEICWEPSDGIGQSSALTVVIMDRARTCVHCETHKVQAMSIWLRSLEGVQLLHFLGGPMYSRVS